MPAEDRHPHVDPGYQEEGGQPEASELHLSPVEDNIGQVSGDQGIDTARGSGQVHVGVGDGGGQRPGCHTRHVDEEYPPPPVVAKGFTFRRWVTWDQQNCRHDTLFKQILGVAKMVYVNCLFLCK